MGHSGLRVLEYYSTHPREELRGLVGDQVPKHGRTKMRSAIWELLGVSWPENGV